MHKILLIGQDFRLLATRAAVLSRTDASVISCNAGEALGILGGETFDLVVLCHSLSETQATEITDAVHRQWPETKILLVVSDIVQERFYAGLESDATSSPEPAHLIRRANELLKQVPCHCLGAMPVKQRRAAS
jgi:CheY-like chemotaxis protein